MSYVDFFQRLFTVSKLRIFVVSPGRSFQSRIGVEIARDAGLRTVDIQAGAISRLRRFRSPLADIVTCIDRSTWDIYRNHYRLPQSRISVTGSARIDALLKPVREADQMAARRAIFGAEVCEPVLFVATQPIEVDRMAAIVEVAMSAVESGWRVILKPHPRESDDHIRAYQALRECAAKPDLVCINRDLDVYQVVLASNVIATYFSTVGQEAFALGRRVLVIDPFETPPDLDYAAIGLAMRARNASELRVLLVLGGRSDGTSSDPYLAVLQDGHAAERVWRTIVEGVAIDPAESVH